MMRNIRSALRASLKALRIVARATPSMGEEPFAPRTSPIIGKNSNVRPSLRLTRPLRFSRATLFAVGLPEAHLLSTIDLSENITFVVSRDIEQQDFA
jgi:hypothetical protein